MTEQRGMHRKSDENYSIGLTNVYEVWMGGNVGCVSGEMSVG